MTNLTVTPETFRGGAPAAAGDSGCVHEPVEVAAASAARLCLPADADRRPQPAGTRPPSAVLARPPQPAVHGRQPAPLPATRSVQNPPEVVLREAG